MKINVTREQGTTLSTPGKMYVDGAFVGYTLEPRRDQSLGKPYAIPLGTYAIELEFSPHFRTVTPHVLGVPGFEYIEIHWGNYPKDTEGCCMVGLTHGADFIGESRVAFEKLMAILNQATDAISITYQDAFAPTDFEAQR